MSTDRPRGQKLAQYFNTAAVVQPALGTYGTIGRGSLRGLDAPTRMPAPAVFFRCISANPRTRLSAPSSSICSIARSLFNPKSAFEEGPPGQITATSADPRILQFSLKVGC